MPYVKSGELKIHYEIAGNESGDVVLFLHGLGSSGRDWETQVAEFKSSYRTLTVDVRGHGQSDKPHEAYSIPQFARDAIAVLDHLEIDSVHAVGVSMGGMIAFQLAVDFPSRLKSMVIVNSGPALILKTLKEKFTIWLRFVIVRFMGMQKMGETLAPRLFVDPELENERQIFIQRWAENDPKAYMEAMRALVGWSVEDDIHKISCPILVVASDMDYTPVALKEAYVSKLQNANLVVLENAHHAVPMERPEMFNKTVMNFIDEQANN